MNTRRYGDKKGHELFVSDGIGDCYATFWRKPNGSLHRYTSPKLPLEKTFEKAQEDLDRYAARRGWKAIEEPSPKAEAPAPESLPVVTPPSGDLKASERKILDRCERTIREGLRSFVEVGRALAEIKSRYLYRQEFDSFEAYCKAKWSFGKSQAYRLIDAATVVRDLADSPIGDDAPLPATESQARPLTKVDDDQRAEVWQEVLQKAPKGDDGTPRVTAELVEQTVRQWITPGDEAEEAEEIEEKGEGRGEKGDSEKGRRKGKAPSPKAEDRAIAEPPNAEQFRSVYAAVMACLDELSWDDTAPATMAGYLEAVAGQLRKWK